MSKDGLCATLPALPLAWGRPPRPFWQRAARASSSIIPAARRKPKQPPTSAAAPAPKSWWCRATFRAMRLQGGRGGRGGVGGRCARQQCRHHQARAAPTISDGLSAEFSAHLCINTIGPFQMIRAAHAQLEAGAKASGPSAVVNVSSVAGISGGGSSVAYAASKGALNIITRSLARALAPLIRVNTVSPAISIRRGSPKAAARPAPRRCATLWWPGSAEGRLKRSDIAELVYFLDICVERCDGVRGWMRGCIWCCNHRPGGDA